MAERLGEALLDLRTNDAGFSSGVEQAKGKAQQLGAQMDRTSGSSKKLAAEMISTGRSAAQMSAGFEQAGRQVTAAVGAQRQGMQQLGFQLGDIATMYSLGARPAQIFASQIGQVTQAVQMMSGGTSRLATFLGGPWGIALSVATIALAPFVGKLFESEDALEKVELASDNLADAQDILGKVFDLTTGKLKNQTAAAVEHARALARIDQLDAIKREREARSGLEASAGRTVQVGIESAGVGSFGGSVFRSVRRETVSAAAARQALNGDPEGALRALDQAFRKGQTTPEIYDEVARQINNLIVEGGNVDNASAALSSLASGQLDPRFREDGRKTRTRKGPKGRTDADRAEDFRDDTYGFERQALRARLELATTAEDRADLQRDLLSLERKQQLAGIEATDLTRKQKDALIKQVEALYGREPEFDKQGNLIVSANRGLEGEIIARDLAVRQFEEAQAAAQDRFQAELGMLQDALALADTEAKRKEVALRIYDAQVKEERLRLQAIIDAEARGEVEKKEADAARRRLAALNAGEATGRAVVGQQNETEVERYLRLNINRSSDQINEAIDGIKIDGLEALNDGLTDAIMGAESLGQVFKRVADQIIADLLRIAIQQAVIRPLANALFGGVGGLFGGGGGGGGGSGTGQLGVLMGKFVGGKATGGMIPTGKFAVVGEEGPELAFAGPGGLGILSNPQSRALMSTAGGGTSVSIPISIDATGADAAAIARLNAQLQQLQAELPGRIINTVREAGQRRFLPTGGVR